MKIDVEEKWKMKLGSRFLFYNILFSYRYSVSDTQYSYRSGGIFRTMNNTPTTIHNLISDVRCLNY